MPFFDVPGPDGSATRIHYVVDGPPGAPAVVLSNSLGTDLTLWDAQVPGLVAAGLRVVRYDQRGHGQSSAPPGPYRLDDLGGDVLALLDELRLERASFAGVSLGGMTGQWVASRAPERVTALALCCTSAHMPPASAWAERIATVRRDGLAPMAAAAPARWFTPAFVDAHPKAVEAVAAMVAASDPEGYVACCEAIAAMDLRGDLASIVAPTLVVAGADDPSTPPDHSRVIAGAIAGARLVVVPSASHLALVEQPEIVTALLVAHLSVDRAAAGAAARRAVLGDAHVDRANAAITDVTAEFQHLITRYAWGEVWTRPGLDRRTRSAITVAMLVALGRPEELALHLRGARRNGLTQAELVEILLQSAIYAGVPAANSAFAVARDILAEG